MHIALREQKANSFWLHNKWFWQKAVHEGVAKTWHCQMTFNKKFFLKDTTINIIYLIRININLWFTSFGISTMELHADGLTGRGGEKMFALK